MNTAAEQIHEASPALLDVHGVFGLSLADVPPHARGVVERLSGRSVKRK